MATTSDHTWSKLKATNLITWRQFALVTKINNFEYAIPTIKFSIQKYNTRNNEWNEWINSKDLGVDDSMYSTPRSMSFDQQQQKLYILTYSKLIIFDVKQKAYQHYNGQFGSNSIIINNHFHTICGKNTHSIWNNEQKQFVLNHQFQEFNSKIFHNLVYLKSKKILLCLGGVDDYLSVTDTIYSLNVESSKWTKLEQKLPVPIFSFGCVSTRNDEYVIILGGSINISDVKTNAIHILNTKTMQFTTSGICCPEKEIFRAVNVNSELNEELLCNGYIKQLWNTNTFHDLINIPFYLIQLIQKYFSMQIIHLLASSGKHWKINVDAIITPPMIS